MTAADPAVSGRGPRFVTVFCLGDSEPTVRDLDVSGDDIERLRRQLGIPHAVLEFPRPEVGGVTLIPVRAVACVHINLYGRR